MKEELLRILWENLTPYEMWGQLAEESAELSQAALKMQRLCFDNNKPRKTWAECVESVIEEHADLALCFAVLQWEDKEQRKAIMAEKLARWVDAIRANQEAESCRQTR